MDRALPGVVSESGFAGLTLASSGGYLFSAQPFVIVLVHDSPDYDHDHDHEHQRDRLLMKAALLALTVLYRKKP